MMSLLCRFGWHKWKSYTDIRHVSSGLVLAQEKRCARCSMVKRRIVDYLDAVGDGIKKAYEAHPNLDYDIAVRGIAGK